MTDRRNQQPTDDLAGWEKWPLAALFLANALNVFILYVPLDEMPLSVQWMLPWVRVFCGIAAAASLEGTLIAVTMGRRLGRDSKWSWAAMFAASAFTAMVAYYVHAEVGLAAAGLFMAQAVVLFIYTQHLAQPRKDLQSSNQGLTTVTNRVNANGQIEDLGHIKGFKCVCGEIFPTLNAVKVHKQTDCSQTFKVASLPDLTQHKDAASQNGNHKV